MDLTKFDNYIKDGYIRKVISPCGKFVLFNYTDKCTFEKKWNKITLNARGTVYDLDTGNVRAKSLGKFFNLGELAISQQRAIVNGSGVYANYRVNEKLDGSLGIVYHDGETWRVNTRGSFSSDQAIKAIEMLEKYDMRYIDRTATLLVEIIYPDNKIIVNYGDEEKLVLLAAYLGEEEFFGMRASGEDSIDFFGRLTGMEIAKQMDLTISQMIALQKTMPKDQEGFVVRFDNGFRVKIKGDEYMRMARILSSCSPLAIWEKIKDGKVCQTFKESIPEEIYPDIEPIVLKLEEKYSKIEKELDKDVEFLYSLYNKDADDFNKKVGLYIQHNELSHGSGVFPKLKGSADQYIKQAIRPKGNVI